MADLKKCPYEDCDKPADSGHLRSIHGVVDAGLRKEMIAGKLKPTDLDDRLKKASSKTATGSRRGRPVADNPQA